MIVFGPVPSRRFGRSMGVNNLPSKICSYSCVYCQIGYTSHLEVKRKKFYSPEEIFGEVEEKLRILRERGERIDFLTFVPDGEPSLDVNLGKEIEMLKKTGIKIAVITNSSLLWKEEVRAEMAKADAVSLKIDAIDEKIWRKLNRPSSSLKLTKILDGIRKFAEIFDGTLLTETMMVRRINDAREEMEGVATFIEDIAPHKAYISIPVRPPAESWVMPPEEYKINEAYQIFSERIRHVEYLIGYEGNEFSFTGDVEKDLLSITSVHPMREDAVREFLRKAGATWNIMEKLVEKGEMVETYYRGKKFYVRRRKRE